MPPVPESTGRRGCAGGPGWRAAAALALASCSALRAAPDAPAPAQPAPAFPLSAFSGLGSSFALGNHLTELNWSDEQVAAFIEGVRAAFAGKPYPFDDDARNLGLEMGRRARQIAASQMFSAPGALEKYLKATGRRLNLDVSDSGLWFSIMTVGKGDRPGMADTVVVTCSALAPDLKTKLPDLSGSHYRVRVAELLPGLREGVQMMAVGSEGTFLVPPKLSFGEGPWPAGVDKGEPILFQLKLEDVVRDGAARP